MRSIRDSLTLATCTLLSIAPSRVLADVTPPWDVDLGGMVYSEADRITVVEALGQMEVEPRQDTFYRVNVLLDSITGASPNGATPTDTIQTFTSPSGNSYDIEAGVQPRQDFRDLRAAIFGEWEQPHSDQLTGNYTTSLSVESDYRSLALGASLQRSIANDHTRLSAGVALAYDSVEPDSEDGVPDGLVDVSAISSQGDSASKQTVDLLMGWAQVLDARSRVQLNYGISWITGYQSDPYKIISLIDSGTGATTGYLTESRPEWRLRQRVQAKLVRHFSNSILHLSYRFYWDDWGVIGHTFDAKLNYKLSERSSIQPHLRWAQQSAADFYRHSLLDSATLPTHLSSDSRLAKLVTTTIGLRYSYQMRLGHGLSATIESITQRINSDSGSTVGLQRNQELLPDLNAWMISGSYTFRW